MIVVRVELHSAVTGKVTQLGEMHICNTGESTNPKVCDYTGRVMRKPDFKKVTRKGLVLKHRRLDQTIWHLIGKMLETMGYIAGEERRN